jgi:putative endonuclease
VPSTFSHASATAPSTSAFPNDPVRRVRGRRTKARPGFPSRYGVDRLVWSETHDRLDEAIVREKAIRKWRRAWKIALIEEMNPEWVDLYERLNACVRAIRCRASRVGSGFSLSASPGLTKGIES